MRAGDPLRCRRIIGRPPIRILLALPLLLAITAPAAAAPLCRDSKGLFTPCTGREPQVVHARKVKDRKVAEARAEAAEEAEEARKPPEMRKPRKPRKPELVATGRLCRDSKGLFTPCPR